MRNDKGDVTIKSIWKWLRSDKGKKYSFFLFYIFFFIFLFVFLSLPNDKLNSNNSNNTNDTNNTSGEVDNSLDSVFPFSVKNIEDNNYKFTYVINFNDNLAEYLGEKENSNITLKDDQGEYKYTYLNGKLEVDGESPVLINFLDIYEIKRIIKNSKLEQETKLVSDNEYLYTYTIETSTLLDLLEDDSLILEDSLNEIVVRTDTSKEVIEIKFDLLEYLIETSNTDEIKEKYEITITYEENDE